MSGNPKLKPYLDALPNAQARAHDRSRLGQGQARRPAEHRARPSSPAATRSRSSTGSRRTPSPRRALADGWAPDARLPRRCHSHARDRGARSEASGHALLWLGPSLAAHRGGRCSTPPSSSSGPRSAATRSPVSTRARWGAQLRAAPRAGGAARRGGQHRACGWRWSSRSRSSSRSGSPSSSTALPRPPARALGADRAVGGLAHHDLEAVRVDLRLLLRAPQPRCSSRLHCSSGPSTGSATTRP